MERTIPNLNPQCPDGVGTRVQFVDGYEFGALSVDYKGLGKRLVCPNRKWQRNCSQAPGFVDKLTPRGAFQRMRSLPASSDKAAD